MKKIIIINCIIFAALLLLLEACLTAVFYFKDVKNPLILSKSVTDFPYVYYTFVPNDSVDGKFTNEDGLYSKYGKAKPKNALRILLLGGSTARGLSASDYGHTIGACLEEILKKEFPREIIEVVNCGMNGYVAEQIFIFYQLVLSKYNPDIVIGLNGYNDLMSVKLNRYSKIYFAPQNMRQFNVISEGKKNRSFSGRMSYIFPSAFRAADFIKAKLRGQSQYDYSSFNEAEIDMAAQQYCDIIKDIHSFCLIKGISHFEFLQPVRWYIPADREASLKKGAVSQLVDLYSFYEKKTSGLDYFHSLAGISAAKPQFFLDDCHFSDDGNRFVAGQIARVIKESMNTALKNEKR